MKNWLTIGQLATKTSVTQKALRLYERATLLKAHIRGQNNYRYYTSEQIQIVESIKKFKSLGFTLSQIRSILENDDSMNPQLLGAFLEKRLHELQIQQSENALVQARIQKILSSLETNQMGLEVNERKFIMAQIEKLSVVVTGMTGLEMTAQFIRQHLANSGKQIPVTIWDGKSELPSKKPYVLVVSEEQLKIQNISTLSPDIVVIKEVSKSNTQIQKVYTKLYSAVGPHMSTILNADDRAVVELANSEIIRKGKTYYFSKNSGLQPQISKIGGVMSNGEIVEIYGMNQNTDPTEIILDRPLGYQEEIAYLASLAAVMDLGLCKNALSL